MRIVHQKPWWYGFIERLNPQAKWGSVCMALGDTIYAGRKLKDYELVHERVHLDQQRHSIFFGIICFLRYQFYPKYRLKCESEAYRREIDFVRIKYPHKARIAHWNLAKDLSSGLYGNLVTMDEAFHLLDE